MKKVALLTVCLLIAGSLALADDAANKDKNASSDKNITGCLSGPNSEGAYMLQTSKGSVEVGGSEELKAHVGHEVKLTGEWEKSGAAIGEKESMDKSEGAGAKSDAAKSEKGERHFKVSKIDHVSESCTTK